MEFIGHYDVAGRPRQSGDYLLDTRGAVAVEFETLTPHLPTYNVASDVLAIFRGVQPKPILESDALPARKFDALVDNQQFGVLFAVAAAIIVFLSAFLARVYANYRHNDAFSCPPASMDIFSLKSSKGSSPFHSRFPDGEF